MIGHFLRDVVTARHRVGVDDVARIFAPDIGEFARPLWRLPTRPPQDQRRHRYLAILVGRIHLEVRGRVQGVGFRWYVVEKAQELKLAGWVRNKSDGKVEIAAAGRPDALVSFEAAVKSGPRGARVEEVRALSPVSIESLHSPFEIVR